MRGCAGCSGCFGNSFDCLTPDLHQSRNPSFDSSAPGFVLQRHDSAQGQPDDCDSDTDSVTTVGSFPRPNPPLRCHSETIFTPQAPSSEINSTGIGRFFLGVDADPEHIKELLHNELHGPLALNFYKEGGPLGPHPLETAYNAAVRRRSADASAAASFTDAYGNRGPKPRAISTTTVAPDGCIVVRGFDKASPGLPAPPKGSIGIGFTNYSQVFDAEDIRELRQRSKRSKTTKPSKPTLQRRVTWDEDTAVLDSDLEAARATVSSRPNNVPSHPEYLAYRGTAPERASRKDSAYQERRSQSEDVQPRKSCLKKRPQVFQQQNVVMVSEDEAPESAIQSDTDEDEDEDDETSSGDEAFVTSSYTAVTTNTSTSTSAKSTLGKSVTISPEVTFYDSERISAKRRAAITALNTSRNSSSSSSVSERSPRDTATPRKSAMKHSPKLAVSHQPSPTVLSASLAAVKLEMEQPRRVSSANEMSRRAMTTRSWPVARKGVQMRKRSSYRAAGAKNAG